MAMAAASGLNEPDHDMLIRSARHAFDSGRTVSLAWRTEQLHALRNMVLQNETDFYAALHADLGKGEAESLTTELAFVLAEIDHALANLKRWTRREPVSTPLLAQPGRSYVVREPLGVVLVLGAWNLPVPVLLGPAVAAIAAGNAVVMKPSELAPATSALIARLAPRFLDPDAIVVVEGGVDETSALLRERFDHIFYTGNGRVGRIVARAAAEHLTPVTLELGGKNPAIVDRSADLRVTARRLAWAKWMNAGQVCVSPDYVLADRTIAAALVDEISTALASFYGDDPASSADYGRIVNARHHDRITGLMRGHGGTIVLGGEADRDRLYVAPTMISDPDVTSPLMLDEIFGPILPIVAYDGLDEAIAFVRARPKPLVVHAFAGDASVKDAIESRTYSGAFIANDAIINHRVHGLPFGGVGDSGTGAYHGRAGFETFSHAKSVLRRPTILDNALRYPPFTAARLKTLRRFIGA